MNTTNLIKNGKKHVPGLVVAIVVPLCTGALSSLIAADMMKEYHFLNKPAGSPPGWVFPVVWSVLYVIMGLASYLIYASDSEHEEKRSALMLYAAQLAMNFCWTILFFRMSEYQLALIWLFTMWILILLCIWKFWPIDRTAAYLMIPYAVWTTYAAYLNWAVWQLSETPMALPR